MSESEHPRRLYSVTAVARSTCGVILKGIAACSPA
nr:hypothetical 3.6K protein - Chlamydia trachomatis plasmids [Chlamydia trachomatis]